MDLKRYSTVGSMPPDLNAAGKKPHGDLFVVIALCSMIPLIGGVLFSPLEGSHSRGLGAYSGISAMMILASYVVLYIRGSPLFITDLAWRSRLLGLHCLFLILALSSTAWSLAPTTTFSRSTMLVLNFTAGLSLLYLIPHERLFRYFFIVFIISVGFIAFHAVIFPGEAFARSEVDYMKQNDIGGLRGTFSGKNICARFLCCAGLVFLCEALLGEKRSRTWFLSLLGIVAVLPLLYLTMSSTSTATFALTCICAIFAVRFPILWMRTSRAAVIFILLFSILVIDSSGPFMQILDPLFSLLNRDATFTGRSVIWLTALDISGNHPWMGHGFQAFFEDSTRTASAFVSTLGINRGHAHNSFLQLYLDLGYLGAFVALLATVYWSWQAPSVFAKGERSRFGLLCAVLPIFFALQSVTEVMFFSYNTIYFLMYAISCAYIVQVQSKITRESSK
jgi:hypothetical protein